MAIERPHIAWPLRRAADGTLAAVEQDTLDDVRQCVHVLMRTPLGARPLAPATGMPDPTFTRGVDPDELEHRMTSDDNEPRAELTVTTEPIDQTGRQRTIVHVRLADDREATA